MEREYTEVGGGGASATYGGVVLGFVRPSITGLPTTRDHARDAR